MTAYGFTGAQVDRHACIRIDIGDGIHTAAAVQDIGAAVASDNVVSIVTGQRVIVAMAAENVLKTTDTVPGGVSAGNFIGAQVYRDACIRPCIGDGIFTLATVQGVCAAVAKQYVITVSAPDYIVFIITAQAVCVVAADDVLNIPERIP